MLELQRRSSTGRVPGTVVIAAGTGPDSAVPHHQQQMLGSGLRPPAIKPPLIRFDAEMLGQSGHATSGADDSFSIVNT